jgi:hypothetical protein
MNNLNLLSSSAITIIITPSGPIMMFTQYLKYLANAMQILAETNDHH